MRGTKSGSDQGWTCGIRSVQVEERAHIPQPSARTESSSLGLVVRRVLSRDSQGIPGTGRFLGADMVVVVGGGCEPKDVEWRSIKVRERACQHRARPAPRAPSRRRMTRPSQRVLGQHGQRRAFTMASSRTGGKRLLLLASVETEIGKNRLPSSAARSPPTESGGSGPKGRQRCLLSTLVISLLGVCGVTMAVCCCCGLMGEFGRVADCFERLLDGGPANANHHVHHHRVQEAQTHQRRPRRHGILKTSPIT